jgi:hypothetical protein
VKHCFMATLCAIRVWQYAVDMKQCFVWITLQTWVKIWTLVLKVCSQPHYQFGYGAALGSWWKATFPKAASVQCLHQMGLAISEGNEIHFKIKRNSVICQGHATIQREFRKYTVKPVKRRPGRILWWHFCFLFCFLTLKSLS